MKKTGRKGICDRCGSEELLVDQKVSSGYKSTITVSLCAECRMPAKRAKKKKVKAPEPSPAAIAAAEELLRDEAFEALKRAVEENAKRIVVIEEYVMLLVNSMTLEQKRNVAMVQIARRKR